MKEYIKKFESLAAADGHVIDNPFTTTIVGVDLVCNEDNKIIDVYSEETPTFINSVFNQTIEGSILKFKCIKKGCVECIGVIGTPVEITIPEDVDYHGWTLRVVSITEGAFSDNTSIEKITINTNISVVPGHTSTVFDSNNETLKEVVFGNNVTHIPSGLFSGLLGIEKITLPATITSIDEYAFYGCDQISSVLSYSINPVNLNNTTHVFPTKNLDRLIFCSYKARQFYIDAGWNYYFWFDEIDGDQP